MFGCFRSPFYHRQHHPHDGFTTRQRLATACVVLLSSFAVTAALFRNPAAVPGPLAGHAAWSLAASVLNAPVAIGLPRLFRFLYTRHRPHQRTLAPTADEGAAAVADDSARLAWVVLTVWAVIAVGVTLGLGYRFPAAVQSADFSVASQWLLSVILSLVWDSLVFAPVASLLRLLYLVWRAAATHAMEDAAEAAAATDAASSRRVDLGDVELTVDAETIPPRASDASHVPHVPDVHHPVQHESVAPTPFPVSDLATPLPPVAVDHGEGDDVAAELARLGLEIDRRGLDGDGAAAWQANALFQPQPERQRPPTPPQLVPVMQDGFHTPTGPSPHDGFHTPDLHDHDGFHTPQQHSARSDVGEPPVPLPPS